MRALKVFYSDVGEGGVAVNCEKTQFFLNTLYMKLFINYKSAKKESPNLSDFLAEQVSDSPNLSLTPCMSAIFTPLIK